MPSYSFGNPKKSHVRERRGRPIVGNPGPGTYTHSPRADTAYSMLGRDHGYLLSDKPNTPRFSMAAKNDKTTIAAAARLADPGPGFYSPDASPTSPASPNFSMRRKLTGARAATSYLERPSTVTAVSREEPGPGTFSPDLAVPATRFERPQYQFGRASASARSSSQPGSYVSSERSGSYGRDGPGPGDYESLQSFTGPLSSRTKYPAFSMGLTSAFKPVRIPADFVPGPGAYYPTGAFGESTAASTYSNFNRTTSSWAKEKGRSSISQRDSNWVLTF